MAGLPTGHKVDLSTRQAAIERLLELSGRRPSGLIAGSDTVPEHPAGSITLPEIAFQPSAEDAPTGCSTPPPGPPPRATAKSAHINRVSVLSGRVVPAYLKRPPTGTSPEELRPDWSFEGVHELPRSVADVARQAASRIGLDYAGVDVVEDLSTDRVLCLEANAAPGMSVETMRSLYAHVQQVVRQSRDAT